uniref:Uncharacterized protein n=1 Tax=Anopheles farauti TaxID=69004 RepID=A0A182Q7G2_9DIPT
MIVENVLLERKKPSVKNNFGGSERNRVRDEVLLVATGKHKRPRSRSVYGRILSTVGTVRHRNHRRTGSFHRVWHALEHFERIESSTSGVVVGGVSRSGRVRKPEIRQRVRIASSGRCGNRVGRAGCVAGQGKRTADVVHRDEQRVLLVRHHLGHVERARVVAHLLECLAGHVLAVRPADVAVLDEQQETVRVFRLLEHLERIVHHADEGWGGAAIGNVRAERKMIVIEQSEQVVDL